MLSQPSLAAEEADAFYAAVAAELENMSDEAALRFLSRLVLLLSADFGDFERAEMCVHRAKRD